MRLKPVEEAWDLLPGPVTVDSGGSGAELWVYQRPSAARHHRLRPMSVGSLRGQQASAG
ncbi:hypothetical protein OG758_46095 [Streptomyces sp. NBC_01474]|uniref:hypothetical protein n=1 Tax=Streptomyces TaxID=1883 RepID=UPI002DD91973|nr:hypothetical protein [Streptomyces sp. NBC_01474]WSE00893.1 hypothetical protein OG758_46095 [Streptomyces sp. NBC_01474]